MINRSKLPATDLKLTWEKVPAYDEDESWDADTPCGGNVEIQRGKPTRYYHGTRRGLTTERTAPWEWSIRFTRHNETTKRSEFVKLYREIPNGTNLRDAKKIATAIVAEAIRLGR